MSFQTLEYTIAAGTEKTVHVLGSNFHCLYADAPFDISLDGAGRGEMEQGQGFVGIPFRAVAIHNTSDAPLTVKFAISNGEVVDSRTAASLNLGTAAPATAEVEVDTDAVVIVAANTSRRSVTIKNTGGGTVYIGGPGVTVAEGFPLESGEAYSTDKSAGAIYGIAAGAGQLIRTYEEA